MHINDGPPGGREGGSDVDRALQRETNRQSGREQKPCHILPLSHRVFPKALVSPYMVAGWLDRCTGYNHKAHPYSALRYPLVPFPVRCFKQLPCIFVVRLVWFHTWERRQVQRDLSWRA